jgi:DNA modification methylase
MFAKASIGAYLKYDLRILKSQCYFCNINCGGRGADFIERMRQEKGEEYVNKIIKDKQVTVKAYDFYLKLLEEYKQM